MTDKISVSQALDNMVDTDDSAAELKTDVARYEWVRKKVKAQVFLHPPKDIKTVAERHAWAEDHEETERAENNYHAALQRSLEMENKRKTWALIIDVWRSQNANKRAGNI